MSINGKWIKIQSYKHDGRLHRFWRKSYVLDDNENWLVSGITSHSSY
jgi:protein associated with RNAse G/E